jgi:L-ascorbate metabolism protein UlaG (beta-lactamase superfamily)
LSWFGVSTFRLTVARRTIWLDAYVDRVPSAPPVGITAAGVREADWILVGHSHFDHVWGAETIAKNTGATIVGSYETVRIMELAGVPSEQLICVAGGERVDLGGGVLAQVFPSQHSCIWSTSSLDAGKACLGDLGVSLQERASTSRRGGGGALGPQVGDPAVLQHLRESNQGARGDGGALAFLLETPEGRLWWNDSSGYWTGLVAGLRPDAALVAAAGRGNIDGDPVQGSLAEFVVGEIELLAPRRVALCHHDAWLPPAIDDAPIRRLLAERRPVVEYLTMGYGEERPIFAG